MQQTDAAQFKPASSNRAGVVRSAMRKELDHRSAQKTDQMVHPLPSTLPWKEYIANHLEADQIIGPGITRASLQLI